MPDLLLELFSEEIPARMQARAARDLQSLVTNAMVDAGLTYAAGKAFATPRRLVLALTDLPAVTPASVVERKGPRTDAPEKAIDGFLRATGLARDALEVRNDKKGQIYFAVERKPGRPAPQIVGEAVTHAVRNLPWPKSMRWGSGPLRWVRPLHSILCILSDETGTEVVPIDIDGITAGDVTRGHRFRAPEPVTVRGFDDYVAKLAAAHVVLDPSDRVAQIEADMQNLAFAQGLEVIEDRSLLDEVAGLVEWPVVLMGEIDGEFLDLPPEVLQTSMREHQKFFSLRNPATGRIERFVTVANVEAADGGATVLAGNRKVLAARLADAKFFWENDLRLSLDDMAAPLSKVTFHSELGTVAQRLTRIRSLTGDLARYVPGTDSDLAARAAEVCKADLTSSMVYEFPELQGTMGRYYALHAGEHGDVADACRDHYAPLGPSDAVPTAPVTIAVALAEKIDVLAGFWAIDEKPTGSKDPFALRRAALGVIRLILENDLRLPLLAVSLRATGHLADQGTASKSDQVEEELLGFLADRLKVYLRDQAVRHDVIQACFELGGQDDLVLLVHRIRALQAFLETEDGANLLAGYRRARNILNAEEKKDGVEYSGTPDVKFAEHHEETALFDALDVTEPKIVALVAEEDFVGAMKQMASLRAPIDAFFEKVIVNADNQIVRRNRLCLLHRVRATMAGVAVFDALEG